MRKKEIVKVPPDFGRDSGKTFQITEWSAETAEKWAVSSLLAYNRGGGQIPLSQMAGGGMEAIAILGVNTFLRGQMQAEEVLPILDQLLDCVEVVRDPKARDAATGLLVVTPIVSPDDIEEVKTRLWLRSEVLRVHTGFSMAAVVSNLISAIMTRPDTPTT